MGILNKCDLCEQPARWSVVVSGCSEHKTALKAAIDSGLHNTASPKLPSLEDCMSHIPLPFFGTLAFDCMSDGAKAMYRYIAQYFEALNTVQHNSSPVA